MSEESWQHLADELGLKDRVRYRGVNIASSDVEATGVASGERPPVLHIELPRVEVTGSRFDADLFELIPDPAPAPAPAGSGSISPINAWDGFFIFNRLGRGLKGAGRAAVDAVLTPYHLAAGGGNLLRDAWGYGSNVVSPQPGGYQPKNGLVQSIKQNGVAGTVGEGIVNMVRNAPGIGLVSALGAPNRDWAQVGGQVFNTAAAVAGARGLLETRVSGKPAWLRRIEEGNAFNAERRAANSYPYHEVYVEKGTGSGYFRLDSYNPATGEIVSRKFTQFAGITERTGIDYVNEISAKYPVGAKIANVPTNMENGLAGQALRGRYILEVPKQASPVPQAVVDAANRAGVLIRDVNGRVY